MSSQQIIVLIKPDGQTQVRTVGFSGRSCLQASRILEQALGSTITQQYTPDYYKSDVSSSTDHITTEQNDSGQ